MSINTYCDSTFDGSNVTINGTSSNTVPALRVTESGDNLFEVGPTNSIAFRLGDIDGLGDEAFIEGGYSDIKFKANSNTTAIFDANNRVTINSSTAGAYQLGVNGVIATTSAINWGMANLSSSPSFTMGVDATSGYLEIDEVTSGGTLKIGIDNTRIASNGVYLEGGLASATPSQYLGRVTGSGGGVMVGRTAAQVLADIGAAPATGGAYLPLAGGTMTGDLRLNDSIELELGSDADIRMYHDNSNGYINSYKGDLYIRTFDDDKDIIFQSDDGSGGVESYLKLDGANRSIIVTAALGVYHNDGIAARFGNNGDLQIYHDGSNSYIQDTGTGDLYIKGSTNVLISTASGGQMAQFTDSGSAYLYHSGSLKFYTTSSGVTIGGDLIVDGGDITLAGTGRIQGIDTVSAGTDAANKTYVDNAVAGAGSGTFLPLAGGTMTGLITDLECANDLVTGKTGAGNIYAKDSGNTFWQVFKSSGGTYMTAAGTSSDSIFLGAPTSSVTTNLTVSGNLQTGNTGDGSLTLKQSGTMFLQMFSTYSSAFINTGTSGSIIYFGNTSGLVQNVNVAGFLDADNFKINNSQGSDGQVMTSTGSGVAWETPSTPGDGQINGATSGLGLSGSMSATANQTGNTTFTVTSNASTAATASTIAYRDGSADISGRLFRANYTDQSTISGAIAYRVNNSSDNYTRYCNSPSAIRAFIGAGTGNGTITGSGTSGQIPIFNSSTGLTSNTSFKEISTGKIYAESQFQVKGINAADFTSSGDTDTGLGSFDGANGVSLVSKGAKNLTVKEGSTKFDQYTATAVATTGSLNANQNNQAPTQDTLAQLCVDPSGNVVRGEQEGTWTFTRAQLNSTLGNTLIAAPGANKAIIVTESDWMVKYSAAGAVSGNQSYDVRQANIVQSAANISTLPGARINEIMNAAQGTPVNPSYGFCARDIPLTTRTYKTNVATTLNKKTNDQLPAGLISISIKLKYRIFDATTF